MFALWGPQDGTQLLTETLGFRHSSSCQPLLPIFSHLSVGRACCDDGHDDTGYAGTPETCTATSSAHMQAPWVESSH